MADASAMIGLNTRWLFRDLLRPLRIDTVCDVGAMDGSEALAFRARLPAARVVALEPNPENFRRMSADPRLAAAGVELIEAAATAFDGDASFFVVDADFESRDIRRGHSSLRRRDAPAGAMHEVRVRALRLDTLLALHIHARDRLALWIDAEGLAYEVLEGTSGVLTHAQLLHVELESAPCISRGQRLAPEVVSLLAAAGFDGIATDHPDCSAQFNAVFLRRGQDATTLRRVQRALAWAAPGATAHCWRRRRHHACCAGWEPGARRVHRAELRESKQDSSAGATRNAPLTDK